MILGISSSQLTFTPSFLRGVQTTNQHNGDMKWALKTSHGAFGFGEVDHVDIELWFNFYWVGNILPDNPYGPMVSQFLLDGK